MKVTRTITGDEPVELTEMKRYLRISHSEEDADIERLITHARQTLEEATGRSLIEQTIELEAVIDGTYHLPYGPISSITTITIDGEDVSDDVEDYSIDDEGELVAEYEAGPYECAFAVKEFVAFLYSNRGSAGLGYSIFPTLIKRWIQNNTMNLWLG